MKTCSIIIPTYNRPYYLKRILSYYNKYGKDFNIVVADSSPDEAKRINKKTISSLPNLKILYLADYSPTLDIFYKVADAMSHVKDKYCVICADDDFVTPTGINKAADFLEREPDFTCAHGHYIGFCLKDDEKKQKQVYCAPGYSYTSITSPDPKTRLLEHLSNYNCATFYAVHRTDVINMVFKETFETENQGVFGELAASMLTLIYGKMKHLDVFYCVREAHPDSDARTAKRLPDYVDDGTYDYAYTRFRDCLASALSEESQISIKQAGKIVDKGWTEYTKMYKGFLIPKINYMMKNMPLPTKVDEGGRKVYRKIFQRPKFQKNVYRLLQTKVSDDIPVQYLYDLEIIKKHTLDNLDEKSKILETITV